MTSRRTHRDPTRSSPNFSGKRREIQGSINVITLRSSRPSTIPNAVALKGHHSRSPKHRPVPFPMPSLSTSMMASVRRSKRERHVGLTETRGQVVYVLRVGKDVNTLELSNSLNVSWKRDAPWSEWKARRARELLAQAPGVTLWLPVRPLACVLTDF